MGYKRIFFSCHQTKAMLIFCSQSPSELELQCIAVKEGMGK